MNTDLDGTRPLVLGLTRINGIGHRVARVIANMAHLDHHQLLGRLSDSDLANLEGVLKNFSDTAPEFVMNRQNDPESGKSMHLFSQDLTLYRTHDINLMKKIRCYKGIRHETGHKVRGQRTKSNGRKGLALGVIRQKALAEAKAKGESEGKSKEEKK
jgi:small subunit ribosomal protein S13